MAETRLGERQIGGPGRGLVLRLLQAPRASAMCGREKAETKQRVTGKEKSCRRGWPRHTVSFPLARRLLSREGKPQDEGPTWSPSTRQELFHPEAWDSVLTRRRHKPTLPPYLGTLVRVGSSLATAWPPRQALRAAAGADFGPRAFLRNWIGRWVGADVQAGG